MSNISIAIVGATGLVGSMLLDILAERDFPIDQLYVLASAKSAGAQIDFKDRICLVEDLSEFDFSQTQLAFFCVGSDLAEQYIPKAVAAGNIVIDKSFHYRNHDDVPLLVPEVNPEALNILDRMRIISSPNCNTIPIAVALKPIYDAVGISRINIATYQSVSGTGKDAVAELRDQTDQLNKGEAIQTKVYPQQIAYNVLPHIDDFQENGYTREEMKMVWELKKIFADESLAINPTAVRVPVFCGHAAAVHIETRNQLTEAQARKLLSSVPGITLVEGEFPYPTPAKDAAGKDNVFVGRLRSDISHPKGFNLWVVGDNLRKGAALNAVHIAEYLLKEQKIQ